MSGTKTLVSEPTAEIDLPGVLAAVRRREWIVLLVLAAVQFTSIVDFVVMMPLGPELMKSLHIGTFEFGLVVEAYTFAAGIAGLLAASLVDRYARRTAFLTLYTGFLVGTLLCALAPNYQLLIAARALTGCFGGILGGIAMAIVGDVFPEERRGRATGVLMSAFAVASIIGVPFGLVLGQNLGWHVPFLAIVVLGVPVLIAGWMVLPRLADHIGKHHAHPLRSLLGTFSSASNWNAFALMASLMIGAFAVIPYINPYLVGNVGVPEKYLWIVYAAGGALTLFTSRIFGKLSDHYGKLRMFRIIAPFSAMMLIVVTNLPPLPSAVAIAIVAGMFVTNSGRMIPAMAMVTGSVPPQSRGGFMSANSSMQHIASGLGTLLASYIIVKTKDGRLEHFSTVGHIACIITLLSLWLAGRLQPAISAKPVSAETELAGMTAAEQG
jgi:predicted MFS family arabinose efflux permease